MIQPMVGHFGTMQKMVLEDVQITNLNCMAKVFMAILLLKKKKPQFGANKLFLLNQIHI